MPSRGSVGRWGEDQALLHLQQHGHTLVARNYRCPFGEVDLITQHGEELVFVEVKARLSKAYGPPELAVTASKRQHLRQTAAHFLIAKDYPEAQLWRIDVVSVLRTPDGLTIDVFENAVGADE